MKKFGLIGKDISYSLSPQIHRTLFQQNQLPYVYDLYDLNDLAMEIGRCRQLSGFNVTIPYKEAILEYCVWKSDAVNEIGACNTILVKNGEFHAYNTDVYGFNQLLTTHQVSLNSTTKVLIIGSGGAAKAVKYCFEEKNIPVFITNRSIDKARSLSSHIIQFNQVDFTEFDLVINATSVGVKSYQSPVEIKKIKPGSTFIDLNYQNHLKFLDDSKALGAKTINGLTMLIYQAAKSFEIWTGIPADINTIEAVLRR